MARLFILFTLVISMIESASAQMQRPISGVVAATSGPVQIRYVEPNGDDIGRVAGIGDPVYLNDEIITGPDTSLQILLKDQTVFSIGPNAVLVFDEFIYDPAASADNSLSASVKKGAFKFISGKISKKNPLAMKLKLPNATASVRGTTVAGRVTADGQSDVILLSGAISVTNDSDGLAVDIIQPGWGTSISSAGEIAPPFQLPPEAIDDVLSEATVEAPAEQQEENGETGTASAVTNAVAPVISEQAQLVAAFTEEVTTQLAANGETEVSFNDVLGLLLANDALRAQLEAQGIDTSEAPDDLNYAYLDTQLISMLAGGGNPEYLILQSDGGGGHRLGHGTVSDTLAGLISNSYSGSVNFASSGLAFAARGDATSASGTASYDYSISYDDATATGTYSIEGLVIDGVTFGDLNDSFTNVSLNGAPQASYEDDTDFQLNTGQEMFEVELATKDYEANGVSLATVQLNSSVGSITDGTTVIDGLLGGTNIIVTDNVNSGKRARVEKYEVGRLE